MSDLAQKFSTMAAMGGGKLTLTVEQAVEMKRLVEGMEKIDENFDALRINHRALMRLKEDLYREVGILCCQFLLLSHVAIWWLS